MLRLAPSLQNRKDLPYIKAATCYSENSFFKNRSQQQQLASSGYQHTQLLVKFLINTCLRPEFSAQLFRIEHFFPLHEAMCSYEKSQFSAYDPTKLAIYSILPPEDDLTSKCGPNVKKTVLLITLYTSLAGRTW